MSAVLHMMPRYRYWRQRSADSLVYVANTAVTLMRLPWAYPPTCRAQAALNDAGLSQAWWFSKINVTGAWSLLSLSAANINARSEQQGLESCCGRGS